MHDMGAQPDTFPFRRNQSGLGNHMRYGAIPSNPIVKNENTQNTPPPTNTKMERVRGILTPENSAIGIRIEYIK